MFKSFIYLLGLCSLLHATIDVVEIPQGRERLVEPTSVVISHGFSKKEYLIEVLQNPDKPWGIDLFIGLDGGVTCFVPNDAQLANREKFPSKAEDAREMRDRVKDINDSDYARLANYLMHGCYATGLSRDMEYGWGGKTGCANFSINILLETIMYFMLRQDDQLDAIYNIDRTFPMSDRVPYTDEQIDTVYNVLQALTTEGIDKKNILGLSDVDLSMHGGIPLVFFWKRFYERHDGFLLVPTFSTNYSINNADELENALLRIGYTNPINPVTHSKLTGDDCWLRRAINAFIFHYLPEDEFSLDLLDETADTEESDSHLNISEQIYNTQRALYPPAGIGYGKEQTYNMLRDKHPEILSAIEEIAKL